MTSREFFVWTLKDESKRFERVFNAVLDIPEEKWSYRPDPRSRSTEELVRHTFGSEMAIFEKFLKTGTVDGSDFEKVMAGSAKDAMKNFGKQLEEAADITGAMKESEWEEKAVMTMGGNTIWETTKGAMAWSFLLDLIHHRGQLSVHLRPMGGKVPAIYGPSGDSQES